MLFSTIVILAYGLTIAFAVRPWVVGTTFIFIWVILCLELISYSTIKVFRHVCVLGLYFCLVDLWIQTKRNFLNEQTSTTPMPNRRSAFKWIVLPTIAYFLLIVFTGEMVLAVIVLLTVGFVFASIATSELLPCFLWDFLFKPKKRDRLTLTMALILFGFANPSVYNFTQHDMKNLFFSQEIFPVLSLVDNRTGNSLRNGNHVRSPRCHLYRRFNNEIYKRTILTCAHTHTHDSSLLIRLLSLFLLCSSLSSCLRIISQLLCSGMLALRLRVLL